MISVPKTAFAIVAHPDDIEFRMAGALLLLQQAGYEIHTMNLSSGNCGSTRHKPARTRALRKKEAFRAAEFLGFYHHPSFTDDLEIVYDVKSLRRLAAILREVKPSVVLTHPPVDYMEDHTNTCRLAVTAAFARGMPNFQTTPARRPMETDITVYHSLPHGARDPLGRVVEPEFFVDTTSVHERKKKALALHESQRGWLESSQGMDSFLKSMEDESLQIGRMSGRFKYAEGWFKHFHLGFGSEQFHPLRAELGPRYLLNPRFNRRSNL